MSDTNDNFKDLKGLLKLKRHEIPPPGYFNRFSDDVVSRIRAGESGGQNFMERLRSDWPSLATVLGLFEVKPALIGGLATGVCLLLLATVLVTDRSESGPSDGVAVMAQTAQAQAVPEASPALASAVSLAPPDAGITVSTNPVASLQPVATLFGSQQNPLFQPAAFMPAKQ